MFDYENRLTSDTCAQNTKESGNKQILKYTTYNFYGDCDNTELTRISTQCPNLHFRNGYGNSSACMIDSDSVARFSTITHGPERRQMNVRSFVAVPDMSRGCLQPDIESYLLNGQDTTIIRECDKVTEKDNNRFIPFLDCVKDYVDGYANRNYFPVGIDTRESMRVEMRKKCTPP